jgi:hypothetical protein
MMVFAVRIEDVLDATVQRPHDADPRKHRRPAKCRDQDQGFRRSLPLRSLMLSLRKLVMYRPASSSVTSWRPRGSGIGPVRHRE